MALGELQGGNLVPEIRKESYPRKVKDRKRQFV